MLSTRLIGNRIFSYKTLDSTNRVMGDMGRQGLPEGSVVFSEEQTQGRGRLGRKWSSPKAKGLYFSILLRPAIQIHEIPRITLCAAVACAQALIEATRLPIRIRWPNDLLVGDRKLCGILTELTAEADRVRFVVLGIGINVNAAAGALPPEATSLKIETRRHWNRAELAVKLLTRFEREYLRLLSGDFQEMIQAWENYSVITGKRVSASTLGGKVEGIATGIDKDGALWIRLDSGIQTKILSGDIRFLR